jgi:hypothetical protein
LIQPRKRTAISLAQVGAILCIVIATYFLVDLTRTAWKNYLLGRIIHEQQIQIDRLKAENERLANVKQVIEQDSFVELWARQRGWVHQGEVRIVPVPITQTEDEVAKLLMPSYTNASSNATSNWQAWWMLFFDSP